MSVFETAEQMTRVLTRMAKGVRQRAGGPPARDPGNAQDHRHGRMGRSLPDTAPAPRLGSHTGRGEEWRQRGDRE